MALIVVEELGLAKEVEFVLAEGTPLDASELRKKNPLKKIPFLELTGGQIVYDSRVVCEALLQSAWEGARERMLPAEPSARLETLTRQALGLGCADASVAAAYEMRLRPEDKIWPDWVDAQLAKTASALDAMEASAPPEGRLDLADAMWAALPPYLELRSPDRPWRSGRPKLAAWFDSVKTRPSVAAIL